MKGIAPTLGREDVIEKLGQLSEEAYKLNAAKAASVVAAAVATTAAAKAASVATHGLVFSEGNRVQWLLDGASFFGTVVSKRGNGTGRRSGVAIYNVREDEGGTTVLVDSDNMSRSGVSAPMPGGAVSAANVLGARQMGPFSRKTRTSRGLLQDPKEGSARGLQAARASAKVSSSGDLTTSASRPKVPLGTLIVPRSQFAVDARAEKGDKEYQNGMLMPDSKDYITSSVFA